MFAEIKNATVVAIEDRQITMQNGVQRPMQLVQVSSRDNGQIVLDGFEVWDDNVQGFALAQGQVINALCKMMADTWGGRWRYTLRAVKVEQIQTQTEGAAAF